MLCIGISTVGVHCAVLVEYTNSVLYINQLYMLITICFKSLIEQPPYVTKLFLVNKL